MEGSRFDAWTRRGFGVAAGGLAGSLLAVSGIAGVAAKKKKCRKFGEKCEQSGQKKCCCGLECHSGLNNGSDICCVAPGFKCKEENADKCCSGLCELNVCVCKTLGQGCLTDRQCCSGNCDQGECIGVV